MALYLVGTTKSASMSDCSRPWVHQMVEQGHGAHDRG